MKSKKSLYATLAAFTAFCGGVPGFPDFGGSGKYPKSYNRLKLKGMSSEEMGTKGKKGGNRYNDKRTKGKKIH